MPRENEEYYEDSEVFEDDVIKFKDIIKTIDIAKYSHSQREFCEIVETIYAEVFNNKKEVNNVQEDKQDK
tara:strand:- start:1099 stop:1308 length:210 start_codon:yes stop_codon:yes gene_type:complete